MRARPRAQDSTWDGLKRTLMCSNILMVSLILCAGLAAADGRRVRPAEPDRENMEREPPNWDTVRQMVLDGRVGLAVEMAEELLGDKPDDAPETMRWLLSELRIRYGVAQMPLDGEDPGVSPEVHRRLKDVDWVRAARQIRRMMDWMWEAWENTERNSYAVSYIGCATKVYGEAFFAPGVPLDEMRKRVGRIVDGDKANAKVLVAAADFYILGLNRNAVAMTLLNRAETLARAGGEDRGVLYSVHLARADLHRQAGDRDQERLEWLRIIQLDPGEYAVHVALCRLGALELSEGNAETAQAYLAIAGTCCEFAEHLDYDTGLALDLIRAGHSRCALRYLQKVHDRQNEPAPDVLYGLGLGHFKEGREDEAAQWLNKYLETKASEHRDMAEKLLVLIQDSDEDEFEK